MKLTLIILALCFAYVASENRGALPMIASAKSQQAKDAFRERIESYVAALGLFTDNIGKVKDATKSKLERAVGLLNNAQRESNEIITNFRRVCDEALNTIYNGIDNAKNNMISMLWTGSV